MTLSVFPPANASRPTSASNRLAPLGGVVPKVGRLFRSAAARIGEAIAILVAYRTARKRLEAAVQGDLFDDPALWAEIKSVAWAEAWAVTEHRKDLPSTGDRPV
jgi:hypothetical protein